MSSLDAKQPTAVQHDAKQSPSMQRFIDTWEGKGLGKGRCGGEVGGEEKWKIKKIISRDYSEIWLQKEEELDRANRWEATASHLRAAWIKEKERAAEKDAEIECLKANLKDLQILYMKSASSS